MSLTDKDLRLIRLAVREEASSIVDAKLREHLTPVSDELQALRNDIKEIYDMLKHQQEDWQEFYSRSGFFRAI